MFGTSAGLTRRPAGKAAAEALITVIQLLPGGLAGRWNEPV
jgi:hypothetical protein